jgi:hypothetical protein
MKQIRSLLIITLLTTTLSAQRFNAQKGFIVKSTNDTVYGQIKDRSNIRKSVLFQPDVATEFNTLTPADISAFYYEGGYYYRSVSVPMSDSTSERQFLLCLAEGYMSLYYTGAFYYIAKPNSPLAKIDKNDFVEDGLNRVDNRFLKVLTYLMADCPQISRDVERTGYSPVSLTDIVNRYNDCKASETNHTIYKARSGLKPRFGIKAGVVYGNFVNTERQVRLNQFNYDPDPRFSGGLTFNFDINRKLSFQPELLLTGKKAYGKLDPPTYQWEAKIDLLVLQMPLMVYYQIPFGKIRPFAGAGTVAGYILKKDARYTKGLGGSLGFGNLEMGFRGGSGIAFQLQSTQQISLEYNFEWTAISQSDVTDRTRSVSHYLWLRVQI